MKSQIAVILFCLGLVSISCQPPMVSSLNIEKFPQVVARVDTVYSITMPELFDALNNSKLIPRGGTLPVSEVQQFLDSILVDTIAGYLADEVNLPDYFEQYRLYKKQYYDYMLRQYYLQAIYNKIELDSSEIVDFYDNNPDYYAIAEQVYLYHIFIASSSLKNGPDSLYYRLLPAPDLEAETEKYVLQVKEILNLGGEFTDVARKYSHDVLTAGSGGEAGWTSRNVYKDPFDSIAFNLEPGDYSDPYRDIDGWHILYIKDYIAPGTAPLDSTQYQLTFQHLTSIKADSLAIPILDSLEKEINLVYNDAILDTNVYKVDREMWAAILNGIDTLIIDDLRGMEESYRKEFKVDNSTLEMKKEMILGVARLYMLIQAARAAGVDTLSNVIEQEQAFRYQYTKSIFLSESRTPGWLPADSEVEQYFNNHIDEFSVKKPLRVQHIISDDSVFALFLRDQALAGVDFLELAQEHYPGDESIRRDLANLGDIGPEDVSPEFYQKALLTPVGSVSYPFQTEFGYHIIKVLSRVDKPDVNRLRHKILPVLKKQHAQKVFTEFRDKLYSRIDVSFPNRLYPVHLKPLEYRNQ